VSARRNSVANGLSAANVAAKGWLVCRGDARPWLPVMWVTLHLLLASPSLAQRSDTTVLRVQPPVQRGVGMLVEEWTLGGGREAEEYQFTHAFVYPGRHGTLFVVDLYDPQAVGDYRSTVRLYDSAGTFVRSIGKVGQGPGEFTGAVSDVRQLGDGRILLSYTRGILVYSPTGEFLKQWHVPAEGANIGSPILVDPAGVIAVFGARRRAGDAPGTRGTGRALYRFRFDGTVIDTLAPAPPPPLSAAPRIGRVTLPFTPRFIEAWSPLGYFVTAYTATYAVDLRIPSSRGSAGSPPMVWHSGDPVFSLRRSAAPVRVGGAERDDWRQSVTMINRTGRGNANWRWTGPDIPKTKPSVRSLHVDVEGRIWVRLSQEGRLNPDVKIPTRPATPSEAYRLDAMYRWVEPVVFDRVEPTGRYAGQIRFPDNFVQSPPQGRWFASGDNVWAVVHDNDEVETVRRYRVQWPSSPRN
jgi:hypothetical protein